MKRRDFIIGATCGVGAAWIGSRGPGQGHEGIACPAAQVHRGRHGDAGQDRNHHQPPRHGNRHGRQRTSLSSDRAGREGSVRSAAQRPRQWPALLRRRRRLREPSSRGRSAQARASRQGHHTDQDLGARSGRSSRRSRPLPPGTGNRLSRCLPDALPHRRRLDRALQRRDGRFLRSEGERNHSRAWLFLPQHRGAARRGQVALGRS